MPYPPSFTLVIPAYNEGKRLPRFLEQLARVVASMDQPQQLALNVLIVEDGSTAEHQELTRRAIEHVREGLRVKHLVTSPNRGKGAALAHGFRAASGDWVGFMDADGATPASMLIDLFHCIAKNPELDGIVGARVLMLGRSIKRSPVRHYVGRLFATVFDQLFDIPIYDSQCGFKFFKRAKILRLLDQITDHRWVWDTQLVVLAFRSGLNLREFPVDWHEVTGSKVSLVRDPLRMLIALLKFRRSLRE